MNQHVGIGNLTADPEMRYTPQGSAVTQFSIAINEKRGDKENVEFIDYVCWDKLAETVAEWARKGRKVCVTSSYHTERWETNDGQKRSRVRMRAHNVEFLDSPRRDDEEPRQRPRPQEATYEPTPEDLSDLPF